MTLRFSPLAAVALACAIVAPAQAQGRGGFFQAGLSPTRLSPTLQTKLSLTADQKSKLEAIQAKTREQLQALFQGGGGQGARDQLRELNQKAEAEALAVFTADQKKTYEGWKAEAEPYQGLGRTHVALLVVTGLSADQKKQLKDLGAAIQAKRPQPGQGGGREAFQALEQETQAGIKKILNADQAKQFDAEVALLPQFGRRAQ